MSVIPIIKLSIEEQDRDREKHPYKNEIYIPKGASTLSSLEDTQIRLGIQGEPFSGKTTSALTFPNPVVLSFDRKVNAHTHREDVYSVPFYDPEFVNAIIKPNTVVAPPNRRDALLIWLANEGPNLTREQTLIVDNSTSIEEAYHTQYALQPIYSDQGKEDAFAQWRLKIDYFGDLQTAFKSLHCNVIYLCHETSDRDKKGELNGKIRPLLTGQFADKLAGNYTEWFAAITISKPKDDDGKTKMMKWAGIDKQTADEWIQSTPSTVQTIYLWQTQNDELRKLGTTTLHNCPKYILADYKSFSKYRRKPINK